jgi:dGTPase
MVGDLIDTSRENLQGAGAGSAQDIRELGRPVIAFSKATWEDLKIIRAFLFKNMYRAPSVMEQRAKVTIALEELFPIYMQDLSLLPSRWQGEIDLAVSDTAKARLVADYIAGMTDRFALQQHAELSGRDVMIAG